MHSHAPVFYLLWSVTNNAWAPKSQVALGYVNTENRLFLEDCEKAIEIKVTNETQKRQKTSNFRENPTEF